MKTKAILMALVLGGSWAVAQENDDMYFTGKDRVKVKETNAKDEESYVYSYNDAKPEKAALKERMPVSTRTANPEYQARLLSEKASDEAAYFNEDYQAQDLSQIDEQKTIRYYNNNNYGSSYGSNYGPSYGSYYGGYGWNNSFYDPWSYGFSSPYSYSPYGSYGLNNYWSPGWSVSIGFGSPYYSGYYNPYYSGYYNPWGYSYYNSYSYYPTAGDQGYYASSFGKRDSRGGAYQSRYSDRSTATRGRQQFDKSDANVTTPDGGNSSGRTNTTVVRGREEYYTPDWRSRTRTITNERGNTSDRNINENRQINTREPAVIRQQDSRIYTPRQNNTRTYTPANSQEKQIRTYTPSRQRESNSGNTPSYNNTRENTRTYTPAPSTNYNNESRDNNSRSYTPPSTGGSSGNSSNNNSSGSSSGARGRR